LATKVMVRHKAHPADVSSASRADAVESQDSQPCSAAVVKPPLPQPALPTNLLLPPPAHSAGSDPAAAARCIGQPSTGAVAHPAAVARAVATAAHPAAGTADMPADEPLRRALAAGAGAGADGGRVRHRPPPGSAAARVDGAVERVPPAGDVAGGRRTGAVREEEEAEQV
jgi:hypothetical protein